jgi:hypothetical protein
LPPLEPLLPPEPMPDVEDDFESPVPVSMGRL